MRDGDNLPSYAALERRCRELGDLGHAQAMLSWDEAVMMPSGGGARRADALATLAGISHRLLTAAETGELLDAASEEPGLDDWQLANLREFARMRIRAMALPEALVMERSRQSTRCEQLWREARAANDWRAIVAPLGELIELTREAAQALGAALGVTPYDALLEQYQPGIDRAQIDPIFAQLRAFLPDFIGRVIERRPRPVPIDGPFPLARQEALARTLMARLGFDFGHGRLDASHHPFCGGDPDDTRITTRYAEDDFASSLMAVLHETGHALYEQGLPAAWRGQPVGTAAGMAVHESQSLLMEMQVCRGRDFLRFAAPLVERHLRDGAAGGTAWNAENLYLTATRVERGLIRVDADELTYPLHVILRYELEQALLCGDLPVADLPAAWDSKMRGYLGRSTQDDFRDGCMQDVHWYAGLFGYFPSYTLGALIAAQLFATVRRQRPDAVEAISTGDFAPLLAWLRRHVHSRGRSVPVHRLLEDATGSGLDAKAFIAHLGDRYGDA